MIFLILIDIGSACIDELRQGHSRSTRPDVARALDKVPARAQDDACFHDLI
jgi:hypothetical protein